MLLANMVSLKYTAKHNIREYNIEMSHIYSKLKVLKLDLFENLLVHLIFIYILHNFANLRSTTIVRRKSGLLMKSSLIVCEKKKGLTKNGLKC